jgi:hypothetical protein
MAPPASGERERVLVVMPTHWDRKQLAACRAAWQDRVEPVFATPDDADCPFDFDPFAFVEAACAGAFGRLDGVLSSSDYPGAILAAAIAARAGLPGPRPERVIAAGHKYYSRLAQRAVAPEAVPGFALVDPGRPDTKPPLPFPFFLKPVKGSYSVLARRIDDAAALRSFLGSPAVAEFTGQYMAIFDRLVAGLTDFRVDGGWFLAEELLQGELVTVEGFVAGGAVEILGIVDSGLDPTTRSFVRFDYPSALPALVQTRMGELARRVVTGLGLDRTLFNVEMLWDERRDRVSIVEVNPRMCGQFGDLYRKVDGASGYEVALALATGGHPRLRRGAGRFAAAASFPLRVFAPCRVAAAPDAAAAAAAEALFPETLVWNECAAGEVLADFEAGEDGASRRYAVVNLGGASRADCTRRLAEVVERLGHAFEPMATDRAEDAR